MTKIPVHFSKSIKCSRAYGVDKSNASVRKRIRCTLRNGVVCENMSYHMDIKVGTYWSQIKFLNRKATNDQKIKKKNKKKKIKQHYVDKQWYVVREFANHTHKFVRRPRQYLCKNCIIRVYTIANKGYNAQTVKQNIDFLLCMPGN